MKMVVFEKKNQRHTLLNVMFMFTLQLYLDSTIKHQLMFTFTLQLDLDSTIKQQLKCMFTFKLYFDSTIKQQLMFMFTLQLYLDSTIKHQHMFMFTLLNQILIALALAHVYVTLHLDLDSTSTSTCLCLHYNQILLQLRTAFQTHRHTPRQTILQVSSALSSKEWYVRFTVVHFRLYMMNLQKTRVC